jgi:hypothetical protein
MSEPSFDPEDIPQEFMTWWAGPGQPYQGASYALVERALRSALDEDGVEAYAFVELEGLKWLMLLMSRRGVVLVGLRDSEAVESRLIGQLHGSYREEWRISDGEIVSVAIVEHAALPGNRLEFGTGPPPSGRGFEGTAAARRRRWRRPSGNSFGHGHSRARVVDPTR